MKNFFNTILINENLKTIQQKVLNIHNLVMKYIEYLRTTHKYI
jgi:hypothetical protein